MGLDGDRRKFPVIPRMEVPDVAIFKMAAYMAVFKEKESIFRLIVESPLFFKKNKQIR